MSDDTRPEQLRRAMRARQLLRGVERLVRLVDYEAAPKLVDAAVSNVTLALAAFREVTPTVEEREKRERNVQQLQNIEEFVTRRRAEELAKSLPRKTCPGCFSAIYEAAAAQGWCCDCYPDRERYEQDVPHVDRTANS